MLSAEQLANTMVLGSALDRLREEAHPFELIAHWTQGEFHHDVLLRVSPQGNGAAAAQPIAYVNIATNCNGGIKEVLVFDEAPARYALWHARCPDNPEFEGDLPAVSDRARTLHWFDPCELLHERARSELRREFRRRQRGGGWESTRSGREEPEAPSNSDS